MFEVETAEPGKLKRIAAAGGLSIIVGLLLIVMNVVGPFLGGGLPDAGNLVFGLFGLFVVLLATHPTYQAAERLDEGEPVDG